VGLRASGSPPGLVSDLKSKVMSIALLRAMARPYRQQASSAGAVGDLTQSHAAAGSGSHAFPDKPVRAMAEAPGSSSHPTNPRPRRNAATAALREPKHGSETGGDDAWGTRSVRSA